MATMYDADHPHAADIPPDASIVAGYIDGRESQWTNADWARYPNASKVTITVLGTAGARVCDIETGDLTPASGAAWCRREISQGRRPTCYCNTSTRPAVAAELAKLGLEFVRDVDCWVAQYDNHAEVPAGCVAKQYQSTDRWDISITDGRWPRIETETPAPPPIINLYPGDHMHSIITVVGPIDSNGDGFFDEPQVADADKVINVITTAVANPPDVGGYQPIPHYGVREQNGISRAVLEGGSPGATYRCNVWIADS